tara:strand:+ start:816809 stop:817276 length:468 start_codon:yes stop_codon:yes gene_type:complete
MTTIKIPAKRAFLETGSCLDKQYSQFEALISELTTRKIPAAIVQSLDREIETLNAVADGDAAFGKTLKKTQTNILKLLEKELKLVPKNYYRNLWLPLGMAAFGIPLGVAFGASLGNMGLLALGIPIGMGVGIAVGTNLDKKAEASNNQLNLEIKY